MAQAGRIRRIMHKPGKVARLRVKPVETTGKSAYPQRALPVQIEGLDKGVA
jgi:hypothetical protein